VIKPSFAVFDQLLQKLIMRDLQTVGYTQNRTLFHLCGVTGFFSFSFSRSSLNHVFCRPDYCLHYPPDTIGYRCTVTDLIYLEQ
jgi:hypothetical protein